MKVVGSKSSLHSPEFHEKKRRERRLKLILFLLVLVILIGLPIYLLRTSRFLISRVEVSGNTVTKDEEVESIVARDLSGDYLFILPKSNALLYPRSKVEHDLLDAVPRLSSAAVSLEGAQGIKVSVVERTPAALYCTDVADPIDPSGCSLVDATGFIFAPAPDFSGGVYLVYANASSTLSIGGHVLPPSDFARIQEFSASLGTLGVYPRVFEQDGDEYHFELANGALLEWEAAASLDDIYGNLRAFLETPSIARQADFLERVLYIDLRFDHKVFYKFRDGS